MMHSHEPRDELGVRNGKLEELQRALADERSRRVVFVPHCILNENVRYLGGAMP